MNRGPTAPSVRKRPAIFWGWWIVIGAVAGQFISMGVGNSIVGVFLRPMTEDLDWTSTEYTFGASGALVVGGLASFIVGPLVDRYGARPLMLLAAVVYATCFLVLSRVDALWQFVMLTTIAGGVGFALVGGLVVNTTVSKWFVARRGWAIALGSSGISLAGLIMPVAMTQVVDSIGWRDAYVFLAVLVLAIVVPVAMVMRRRPEDYGQLPDGTACGAVGRSDQPSTGFELQERDAANSYTRREAVRTLAIWLLIAGYALHTFALIAIMVHAIPFMTDSGMTRASAALAVALSGGANLCSKFVWGYFLQRVHVRYLCATSLTTCAFGVGLMLLSAQSDLHWLMFGAFVCWGFGFGGTVPLSEFIWAKYFGRVHIGAVRGASVPYVTVFQALGPVIGGLYFDFFGTYSGIFAAFLLAHVVGAVAILVSREPPAKQVPVVRSI